VESAQLRSIEAVIKWATILAAVATRIERMKYLSRNQPDLPASVELEPIEIEALKIERRDRKKRQKPVLPEMPTLAEATRWIAEMGGWMGEKSSGPPGSITLARGLDRLAIYTHALTVVRAQGGKRRRR
ncbi:MAG: IS4 family transposase, partial [Polyangiaceae bacterium]